MAQKRSQTPAAKKARKTKAKKKREKSLAIGLVAVLAGVLLLSTVLGLPGVQQAVYELMGITERIPDAQEIWDEEGWRPGDIPELQELMEVAGEEAEAARPEADMTAAVHFLDVGQGDAVLLESGGEYALIDAGPPEGIDALMSYLAHLEIGSLKYMIMSHPHNDHIGGMQTVVENIPVEQALLPDFEKAPYPTTSTFEHLLEALLEKEVPAETMRTGASYPLGEGEVRVLAEGLATEDNLNLLSPLLLFESGDLRYLSSGDAERANEQAALDSGLDLQANLFKAGHHGSSTSNILAFLEAVRPWVVVVPCGAGNMYGHPHREALDNFEAVGASVLRTDLDGFIRVSPDGQGGFRIASTRQREEAEAA